MDDKMNVDMTESIDTTTEDDLKEGNIITDIPNADDVEKENKKQRKGRFISYFIVALVASLIGGLVSPYIAFNYIYGEKLAAIDESKIEKSYDTQKINIINGDTSSIISAVAKKVMGSVVGITTVEVKRYGFMEQKVGCCAM